MERVFLSIDWDFFIRMPDPHGSTPTERYGDVSNALIYDWGTSETGTVAQLQNELWHMRAASFGAMGLDIEEEFTIGETSPEEVLSRFNLSGADRRFMVSHAGAIKHLSDLSSEGPFHVVNIDAHHDLGYSESQTENAEIGDVDCGTWLYAALYHQFASKATIVFPDWLEEREVPDHGYDLDVVSFSEMPDLSACEIAGVFIARSDSWSPPYLDQRFMEMCEMAGFDRNQFGGEQIRPWIATSSTKT